MYDAGGIPALMNEMHKNQTDPSRLPDGDRKDHRRKHCRPENPESRGDPSGRKPYLPTGRACHPPWKPGSRGCGRQKRRRRPGNAGAFRTRPCLRPGRRGPGGDIRRPHHSRRRDRRPLRRSQGRAGHARTAFAHLGHYRHGSGKIRSPDHRWTVFRGDTGGLHRTHFPGGLSGLAPSRSSRKETPSRSTFRRGNWSWRSNPKFWKSEKANGDFPIARNWKKVRCWNATGEWWDRQLKARSWNRVREEGHDCP